MTAHGRAGEYLEGLLAPAEEEAFLEHVTTCAACQAELHGEVQLRDREDALRAEAARGEVPPPVPIERARAGRRRAVAIAGVVVAVAAAAAITVAVRRRPAPPRPTLALAPTRAIEARLAWPGAAGFRRYEVMRSATDRGERIDPRAIAALAEAGDCAGVAATYVLSGELARAEQQYATCPATPDLQADRAALALLRGQPEAAIELTDAVLATHPDHGAALWNRALALRDLGLGLAAAAAFERVADREPAWADEARARAVAARGPLTEQRRAYEAARTAARAMNEGGPVVSIDLARAAPTVARAALHNGLRLAPDPSRLAALAALADALEGLAGRDLARHVQVARARRPLPAAVVDGYRAIVLAPSALTDDAWARWLAAARRAPGADDLILGARIVTRRFGTGEPDGAALLAERTGDPWFTSFVAIHRARDQRYAGDLAGAEATLTAAEHTACDAPGLGFRCGQVRLERAALEQWRYRLPEAEAAVTSALALVTAAGAWEDRVRALTTTGDLARSRGRLALARAYYTELIDAWDACTARDGHVLVADVLAYEHRPAEAAAWLRAAPTCDQPWDRADLNLHARLLRAGQPVLARAPLLAAIAAARATAATRFEQDFLDFLAAWIDVDTPEGRAALEAVRARAAAVASTEYQQIAAGAASALVVAAVERDELPDAIATGAAALAVPAPASCALVVAVDEFRLAAIAIDAAGRATAALEGDRPAYWPARWLAPPSLQAALRGCAAVDVLALPPWIGVGPVLAADVPWRYVMGPATAASPGLARRVVVAAPAPPAALGLPALAPPILPAGAFAITGAAATPERVLAEARTATLLEVRAHAIHSPRSDAPVVALSPGATDWALRGEDVRAVRLERAPVVVLASCGGGAATRYEHEAWGLPLAFRQAGARAVIAPLTDIPDGEAERFFEEVAARLAQGVDPAAAVAALRAEKIAEDPASWVTGVVVFQ